MKCSCGKKALFLVDGKCAQCRMTALTATATKATRKRTTPAVRYIVRIHQDWYFDGSQCTVRLPAQRGRRKAYRFRYRQAALKRARQFGGEVETVEK